MRIVRVFTESLYRDFTVNVRTLDFTSGHPIQSDMPDPVIEKKLILFSECWDVIKQLHEDQITIHTQDESPDELIHKINEIVASHSEHEDSVPEAVPSSNFLAVADETSAKSSLSVKSIRPGHDSWEWLEVRCYHFYLTLKKSKVWLPTYYCVYVH